MPLSLELTPVTDTAMVITMAGELDAVTAPTLAAMLRPLHASPVTRVVAQITALRFCDVAGVRQLSVTNRALHDKGGALAVAGAGPALQRLITLMNGCSTPRLRTYADLPRALTALGLDLRDTPPRQAVGRRHLPTLRRLASPGGSNAAPGRRPVRPSPERQSTVPLRTAPGKVTTPSPAAFDLTFLAAAMVRSRQLRNQAVHQVLTLQRRRGENGEARIVMHHNREQCLSSLAVMQSHRASPVTVRD
ncbi:STAS domain-containing protein [Planobispora siamensis]|uniref:STAS domain-containing protein n=1 Tax=Planobispora siamensis TaxID=936338 RepID=A0A8J3SMG7_9ACTN|nr:STAS domain-containing protein [Planobispora siamensis]GIH96937.1 hypothetical protein Psi01_75670 [Planobispora siamensis]